MFIYFHKKNHTSFQGCFSPVRNSLSLSALALRLICTLRFEAQPLCLVLESSGDSELPAGGQHGLVFPVTEVALVGVR